MLYIERYAKMSKQAKVEAYLRAGNTITPLEALKLFGLMRLGAVIHRLRRRGMNITTTLRGKEQYAEYRMVQ